MLTLSENALELLRQFGAHYNYFNQQYPDLSFENRLIARDELLLNKLIEYHYSGLDGDFYRLTKSGIIYSSSIWS